MNEQPVNAEPEKAGPRKPDDICQRQGCGHARKHHHFFCGAWRSGIGVCRCANFVEHVDPVKNLAMRAPS